MARFFVGQRVRLARPYNPRYQDATGVIFFIGPIEWGQLFNDDLCTNADCAVNWDDGEWSPEWLSKLEPILDRHEPCEAEFKAALDELLSRENNNETVK